MARWSSWPATLSNVVISLTRLVSCGAQLVLEVEDLGQPEEAGVWARVAEVLEELGHLGLPADVHGFGLHAGHRVGQGRRLEVADEEPVRPEEQRVVPPAGRREGLQHLRP